DLARPLDAGDALLLGGEAVEVIAGVVGDDLIRHRGGAVVDGDAEAAALHVQHQVLPHYGEANQSEIALAHCLVLGRFWNRKPIHNSTMASSHFVASVSQRPVAAVEAELAPSTVHGADLRFHGVVRDSEEGRPLAGIEYSHYEAMALKELIRIGEAMGREHPGHLALVHHVVGYVAAGEASLLIRVQAKHSAEAFEICREYLRRIKATVPVWKR